MREIFASAGVGVEGREPGDILVKNPAFYGRFVREASIGLGESYMDEWWECEQLDLFIEKLLRADIKRKIEGSFRLKLLTLQAYVTNMQSRARARQVAEKHYDLGNDLYRVMLDDRTVYTCGYWKDAKTLQEAQDAKLDLVCRKAHLKPGMRVLDIGCGFGGFAIYAAQKYGCEVVGVTVSVEQRRLAMEMVKAARVPVEVRLQDYREVYGRFDAVVSMGMFEHVGWLTIYEQIQFRTGSAEILPESTPIVVAVAEILASTPKIGRLRIEGHTDSKGVAGENLDLSRRRATAVVAALIAKGVSRDRLLSSGLGDTRPLGTNSTEDGRQSNRRVEFHIEH